MMLAFLDNSVMKLKKLNIAREGDKNKLQATLVRNYDPLTDSLTGVKCRATIVAKNREILGQAGPPPQETIFLSLQREGALTCAGDSASSCPTRVS